MKNIGQMSHMFNNLIDELKNVKNEMDYIDHEETARIIRGLWQLKGDTQSLYWGSRELDPSKTSRNDSIYYNSKYRQLRRDVFSLLRNKCLRCGSESELQIDHVKPVSKNKNMFLLKENMQILCKPCNSQKSNNNENDYRKPSEKKLLMETWF